MSKSPVSRRLPTLVLSALTNNKKVGLAAQVMLVLHRALKNAVAVAPLGELGRVDLIPMIAR